MQQTVSSRRQRRAVAKAVQIDLRPMLRASVTLSLLAAALAFLGHLAG